MSWPFVVAPSRLDGSASLSPDPEGLIPERSDSWSAVFIRHNVADYGAWKAQYDAFDEERSGMGVTDHAVYQQLDERQ